MAVTDRNVVDSVGIDRDGKTLILLISDHLDWEHEYEHLLILQEKVNDYISFIENEQYKEVYVNKVFEKFRIEIKFMYQMNENCIKFIDYAQKQLADLRIEIVGEFSPLKQ